MATGKAVDQGPGMVLLNGFLVRVEGAACSQYLNEEARKMVAAAGVGGRIVINGEIMDGGCQ